MKATHKGTCQICERGQKLPNNILAKHGYTVAQYGWFVGTCRGAEYLPFERDCSILKEEIKHVQSYIKDETKRIVEWRAENTTNLNIVGLKRYSRKEYKYKLTQVTFKKIGDQITSNWEMDGQRRSANEFGKVSVKQHIDYHREQIAKGMDNSLEQTKQWLIRAQDRVKNWSPKHLRIV